MLIKVKTLTGKEVTTHYKLIYTIVCRYRFVRFISVFDFSFLD